LDALFRECRLQSWQVVLLNKLRKRLVFNPVLSPFAALDAGLSPAALAAGLSPLVVQLLFLAGGLV